MKAPARIVAILALGVAIGFVIAQLTPSSTVAAPWTTNTKFEFRQVRTNAGVQQVFRLNPKTGETWQLGKDKWIVLAEGEKLSAGEYDILVTHSQTETGYWATRVDQVSGKTWSLGKEKWEIYDEPK